MSVGCKAEYEGSSISVNEENEILAATNSEEGNFVDYCIKIKNKDQVFDLDKL